jgi:hypothetical protein
MNVVIELSQLTATEAMICWSCSWDGKGVNNLCPIISVETLLRKRPHARPKSRRENNWWILEDNSHENWV